MKKNNAILFLSILFFSAHLSGQTLVQKFYIDFGQDNSNYGHVTSGADRNGNVWNNVIAPNGAPSTLNAGLTISLVNSSNETSAYELEVAKNINSNGGANGGLTSPDPALLGDLAISTATEDYFFLSSGKGLFKFKNLDTDKAYRFHVYGCRTASGAQRGIIYSLSGRNGSHGKQLNSGTGIGEGGHDGNNNQVWISTPVVPADNGVITLELGRLFNDQMAYISALKMEEYEDFALPAAERNFFIDVGKNNGGLDGAPTVGPDTNGNYWNNIYSNGNGWTEGASDDTKNLTLMDSDNTPTAYTVELASTVRFNGVRTGALGGSDSPNEPTAGLLGDLAIKTATYDYLFIENSSQTAVLHFKNLNPAKQYRFNIFGSRTDAGGEGRVGRIELAGANTVTGIHQMGGAGIGANGENYNNKNIFVSDPVTPDFYRKITLTLTSWLGYAHINCIKLEEIDGEELPVATAINISDGSAITVCGGSLQLTAAASPQGALLPAVTWNVDNGDIARVTETGKLYALANGTVNVIATATFDENTALTATKKITINNQNVDNYSFTVMGSSVPYGTGASPETVNGYARLWTSYLQQQTAHRWTTNNISIGGNTTTDVINRWDSDLLPSCSRYVYYGLSLGNEGIHDRGQAAFNSWHDNMLALIDRARAHGKIPIVGNNYPRGDFNTTDYNYVKQLNLLIHEWNVPSINLLGAIDNGAGRWASGYVADDAHPNTAGHAELYYAIVPSLMDALAAGKPQPVRSGDTFISIEKTATVKHIAFIPEGTLHAFTLTFSFRTTSTGTLASIVNANGSIDSLKIDIDGKLKYKTALLPGKSASLAAINDGEWHQVSLTHYYASRKTAFYVDGVQVFNADVVRRLLPVRFYLNDLDKALQMVDFRELFLHRSAMSAEEIQALHTGRMLKSSLEIYAPLDGNAGTEQEMLENRAQSLNVLTVVAAELTSLVLPDAPKRLRIYPNPVNDVLSVESKWIAKGSTVRIFNTKGILVKSVESKTSGSLNISLRELPVGIYMLKAGGGEETVVKN